MLQRSKIGSLPGLEFKIIILYQRPTVALRTSQTGNLPSLKTICRVPKPESYQTPHKFFTSCSLIIMGLSGLIFMVLKICNRFPHYNGNFFFLFPPFFNVWFLLPFFLEMAWRMLHFHTCYVSFQHVLWSL